MWLGNKNHITLSIYALGSLCFTEILLLFLTWIVLCLQWPHIIHSKLQVIVYLGSFSDSYIKIVSFEQNLYEIFLQEEHLGMRPLQPLDLYQEETTGEQSEMDTDPPAVSSSTSDDTGLGSSIGEGIIYGWILLLNHL